MIEGRLMQAHIDTAVHGRPREDSNAGLIWFTQECMNNGAPLESYIDHAERLGDHELATFFRRALAETHRVRPGDRRRRGRRGRNDRRRP